MFFKCRVFFFASKLLVPSLDLISTNPLTKDEVIRSWLRDRVFYLSVTFERQPEDSVYLPCLLLWKVNAFLL